jgi:hypothetical protein
MGAICQTLASADVMAITKWSISCSEKQHGGLLHPRHERPRGCRTAERR